MKIRRVHLLAGLAALAVVALAPALAAAAWLGGITFSQPTPSFLPHGQHVEVSVDYNHADAGGARIFVVPLTGGGNTPGQGNSGSTVVPAGTGTVTRWFTVTSGSPTVDHVRITMTSADQSVTYFSFEVRVHYEFGPSGIYNIHFSEGNHSVLAQGTDLTMTFDYATTASPDVRVYARPWRNNNLVTGYYASGGYGTAPSGSGSQWFNYASTDADVNQVHFTMYDGTLSTVLLEFNVAVDYHWREVGMTNVVFNKPSPASASLNEHITASFAYDNPTGESVYFWVVPQHANAFPGAYGSYQGSSSTAPGSGWNARYFLATSPGDYDAVRLVCRGVSSGTEYVNVPVPVSYHYDHTSVDNIVTVPAEPAILDVGTQLQASYDYHTDHAGNILTWALPWFEGDWPVLDFNFAAASPLPTGDGSVARGVTGRYSGVAIDHLYFLVTNDDQSATLLEYYLPLTAFWSGTAQTSPVPEAGLAAPVVLGQNYPNPFNPVTTVPLDLDATRYVKLSVFDLRGRRVATLVDGLVAAGHHEIAFDGTKLASGTYICRVEGKGGASRPMTLVK